jgi:hypothetical protein
MKRSMFIMMALLLATPAMGAVTITCTQESVAQGSAVVRIDYNVTGTKVRAFALDVSIDANCAVITNVTGYTGGTGDKYGIFPGTIDLSDLNNPPANIVWGTPVAPSDDPGAEGTGIGTSRVILEMGSLYDPNLSGPPNNGTLCKLNLGVAGSAGAECHVSIAVETARGGVVLEDGTSVGITSAGCDVGIPPDCWFWSGQCQGDTVGDNLIVDLSDFLAFKAAFGYNHPDAKYDPCADYDQNGDIDLSDFLVFKGAFKVGTVPGGCTLQGTWPPP